MLLDVLSSWSFLSEHPLIGFIVFGAVSLGVILVLSGGNLGDSIGGMLRVAFTFFTTPFLFLRDALAAMRSAESDEADYQQSRLFMMFRFSKLQYLGLLVLCLLTLSSGITASLISLYPSAEIQMGRALDEQIERLEAEKVTATQAVATAAAPGFREQLQTQRQETRAAYQQQVASNNEFQQNSTFSGGVISQIASARNRYNIEQAQSNMDAYMSNCPRGYNWRGMTAESCMQFRAFALELADRRLRELDMAETANQAEIAWREADSAAQTAEANLAAVESQLESVRAQRESISLFNPEMMSSRIVAAIMSVLMTLLSVIITVWLGATVISFFSWLVLMMRGLEILQTKKLAESRDEP